MQHTLPASTITLIEAAASEQYGVRLRVVAEPEAPSTPAKPACARQAPPPAGKPVRRLSRGKRAKWGSRREGLPSTGEVRKTILSLCKGGRAVRTWDVYSQLKLNGEDRNVRNLVHYSFASLIEQGRVERLSRGRYGAQPKLADLPPAKAGKRAKRA